MGKSVNLNIRTDKELKISVEHILHRLGLNHSTAINIFYRQISLNKGLPFSVNIPNKETLKAMKESEIGKNVKTFKNSKELFKDLGI